MPDAAKSTPQDVLAGLAEALAESHDALLAVPLSYADRGKNREKCWRRLKLTEALSNEFAQKISEELVSRIENGNVQEFTYDNMMEGHIGVWPAGENMLLEQWTKDVPPANWHIPFDGNDAYRKKLKFLATRLQFPDEQGDAVIYTRHTASAFAQKKSRVAAFLDSDNLFSGFDAKNVIELNHKCDFLVWKDTVFIFNQGTFESLTKIRVITESKASEGFAQIAETEGLSVSSFGEIAQLVKRNAVFTRKVAAAEVMGVFGKLDVSAIAETIKRFGLQVEFEWKNGELILAIDKQDREQVKTLLNLLTDSYTEGQVTHTNYLSHTKELVN